MVIAEAIRSEWHDTHRLCAASCRWLAEHGDPGDLHPIVTGVELLRAAELLP